MDYKITTPIAPQDATRSLLAELPSRRMRDVIERRFGLKGARKHTLEAIGKEYRITRERVRQIEAEALKNLSRDEVRARVASFVGALDQHVRRHGGVMAEQHLFSGFSDQKAHPHVALVLAVAPGFKRLPETDDYHHRWTVDADAVGRVEKVLSAAVAHFASVGHPLPEGKLLETVAEHAKQATGSAPESHVLGAYLATSKAIQKNPYGEYGLASWSSISPSGVRDKAYAALEKRGTPLHFRDVAAAIDAAGWSKRRAHPQTVHNELIKDKRFVLVGRGVYALRDWGYEEGAVRDVIASVLKASGKPLAKDAIVKAVLEKRMVKVPTILLNLQNKSLFSRRDDGTYFVA